MRQSLARFSGPESSPQIRYLADFIVTTSEFKFSVHTACVSVMMLRTLTDTRPRIRRVVAVLTFDARWHRVRPGIDRRATDTGQCKQDNQTSAQY